MTVERIQIVRDASSISNPADNMEIIQLPAVISGSIASQVGLLDAGGFYASALVEGALAEIPAKINRAGMGIVAVGDSITSNYGNGDPRRQAEGYLQNACIAAGQVPPMRGVYGTAGYTLDQINTNHVPTVIALTPKPAACVILGGTNDCAVAAGVGYTTPANIATLTAMCRALQSAGILPILSTLTPRGDNATINQNVGKLNRAIWKLAQENGFPLVDFHRSVCNVATAGWLAGHGQTDNIHPSYLGVKKMGTALAAVFARNVLPYIGPPRPTHLSDPTNLLGADGHFQTDTNADGIGNGWTSFSGTGMTFSIVLDADGITKWQKISMPNTGTGNALLQKAINAVVAAGDTIEVTARVQTTGFEAALVAPGGAGSGGTGPQWGLTVQITGGTQDIEAAYVLHTDQADGVVYARGLITAGATGQIKVNLNINGQPAAGNVTVQYTDVCVRNLTTLALV